MEGEAWMGQRSHSAQSPENGTTSTKPTRSRDLLVSLQSGPLRSGTSSYPPHWHLSRPLYGLCTLTCIRAGGDVPSFRQYLLTVREGPLFIDLLASKHQDAVAGQARPWVWGTGAVPPCDRSRGGPGCDGRGAGQPALGGRTRQRPGGRSRVLRDPGMRPRTHGGRL